MRHADRIGIHDTTQTNIPGLLDDPDAHFAPGGPRDRAALEAMAEHAINMAYGATQLSTRIDKSPMTTTPERRATADGAKVGEDEVIAERRKYIEAALRDPMPGAAIPPHPDEPKIRDAITKGYGDLATIQAGITAMEAELAPITAARGASPIESTWESNLKQQIAYAKQKEQEKIGEIRKLQESLEPERDPFTRAKLQQELARMDGDLPGGKEARAHELGGGLRGFFSNPHTVLDSWRERARVNAERGSTKRQQRREDRALANRGEAPVHGRDTSWLTDIRDDLKSKKTSYAEIARVGNVIEVDGELLFVQDIEPAHAVYIGPSGIKEELFFEDGTPVKMDEVDNLLLRPPGSRPKTYVNRPDPAKPGSFKREEIKLSQKDIKDSIHHGEEKVVLGHMHTREEAKDILMNGAEAIDLAPLYIRLDDLVLSVKGDPPTAKIITGKERKKAIDEMLVWQDLGSDPSGAPKVASPDGRIRVFDGQGGHFVRPFAYPEHRRDSFERYVKESRLRAAADARKATIRPPKDDIKDPSKPYYKGPRRK